MVKQGFSYILTNQNKTVLYTGVTNNIVRRTWEHYYAAPKSSFVGRYKVKYLVYFELHPTILGAIAREKQIKSWKREKKNRLISAHNPTWRFLASYPEDGGMPEIDYPDYDETLDREI